MVKFWFCELCDMRHPNTASLIKHMREDHHCEGEFVSRNPNLVENSPELCPSCGTCVVDVTELLAHARLLHEFDGVVRREVFQNFAEFEQWKERMEDESISTWVKRRNKITGNVLTINMRCHRTQNTVPKNRKSKLLLNNPDLRQRKSTRIVQRSCTSFMDVERNLETDVTSVVYCPEHFGHKQDPLKQSLPWSVKLEIAEMLKQYMFARDIVRILKKKSIAESEDGVRMLKRQYWVTERDVYRVASDLRAHPHKYERMEGISPVLLVKTEPDSSEVSTAPEFIKAEPCSSSSSILESFIEKELGPMRNPCPEEALFKADHDPAKSSAVLKKRLKKEEPCSAFSIAEVIPGGGVCPFANASREVHLKTESDQNPAGRSSSATEKLFFKQEPISSRERCLEEAKPYNDEGGRVFSLAVAPDGKGFSLMDHSPCVDVPQDDL